MNKNINIENEYFIFEFGNIHELEANIVKLKTIIYFILLKKIFCKKNI